MKHLVLIGDGPRLLEIAGHFHAAGRAVTLLPELANGGGQHGPAGTFSPPGLALASTSQASELLALASAAEHHALPWLFLCGDSEDAGGELTTAAYRAGALAVLPAGSAAELVMQAVDRSIESLTAQEGRTGKRARRRHYRAGETIPLGVDEALRVVDGVVAQVASHEDGGEGLVGLWGPEHLLSGRPGDACGLSLRAHTETVVEIDRLSPSGDAFERLLKRARCLEAWSSVQSRQNMEQRLLGVLALLAEQFGEAWSDGTLIDVRVTHAQLASAIGSTRATVTRLLGPLRRRGLVKTVPSAPGERFFLPGSPGDQDPEVKGCLALADHL